MLRPGFGNMPPAPDDNPFVSPNLLGDFPAAGDTTLYSGGGYEPPVTPLFGGTTNTGTATLPRGSGNTTADGGPQTVATNQPAATSNLPWLILIGLALVMIVKG